MPRPKNSNPCRVNACKKPPRILGWCKMHYARWKRHGDPNCRPGNKLRYKTAEEYLRARSVVVASGCWEWLGSKNVRGYGNAEFRREKLPAPRLAYRTFKGLIPKGMLVCHTCDNPGCINPEHLWLGTVADNARDMALKGRARNQWTGPLKQNGNCQRV
jgi:hypothetical protein